MASRKRKCCVPGCDDKTSKRHRFTQSPDLLNVWLNKINNPVLKEKTPIQLYENYRVCHRHFLDGFMYEGSVRGRTLTANAYPTLYLPPKPKNHSRLREFSATHKIQVPQKQQLLYKRVVIWSKKMANMLKNVRDLTERVKLAETCNESPKFCHMLKDINESTYKFILSQLRKLKHHPFGRMYSIDDKLVALSLFNASGRRYKLLSKVFALPSPKSLNQLLRKVPFTAGTNTKMFQALKTYVNTLPNKDKFCVLSFDEMHLQVNVEYNAEEDIIEGISTAGSRSPHLADHVTVFLLTGIHKQWKQPLCYHFSNGPLKTVVCKNLIKEVITECLNNGFKVMATVCNQNCAPAIHLLLKETNEAYQKNNIHLKPFGFEANGQEIIALFDPPHLMKGFRNNLLSKDLKFKIDGVDKIAKWADIEDFYFLDTSESVRLCKKLTDAHVIKDNIKKTNVSSCTQVFSYQVGSLMKRISQWGFLSSGASDTADLILFLDELFDSINSSSPISPITKPLNGGVTRTSEHWNFWNKAIHILEDMKYFSNIKKEHVSVPTVVNTLFTIRGFKRLCLKLLFKDNFNYVLTRCFNQDALENFLALIQSQRSKHVRINSKIFQLSFKTLVITDFMAHYSIFSNCEEDILVGALYTFREILTTNLSILQSRTPKNSINVTLPELNGTNQIVISVGTVAYMSGYFIKKLGKILKCSACILNLKTLEDPNIDYIDAFLYPNSTLDQLGKCFRFIVYRSLSYLYHLIPKVCHYEGLGKVLFKGLREQIDFNIFNCNFHPNTGDKVCKIIVGCAIHSWCKQVNKIAAGKDSKFIKYVESTTNTNIDDIKKQAYEAYQNRMKRQHK